MGLPINSRGHEISVDPRCWDLAEVFLSDFKGSGTTDAHVADLAEELQRCCEIACEDAEGRDTPSELQEEAELLNRDRPQGH
jgi:hypothetical protein